jgi:PAS domain S-box-containing protein
MRNLLDSLTLRYVAAAAGVVGATAAQALLEPPPGNPIPYGALLVVLLAAWFGGFGPALAAVVFGAAAAVWFLPPAGSTWGPHVGTGLYLILGAGIALLGREAGAARRHAADSAEDARQRDELLRVTLASVGDAVITADTAGRVVSLAGVAESLTGWTQGEAQGRQLGEVFRVVHAESWRPAADPIERTLREGKVVIATGDDTVLIARDGSERPVEGSAAPIRDARQQIVGAVLVFRDVTERRRREGARVQRAAIVESSEDAIIGMTLDGVISTWNAGAERLFGRRAEDARGQPVALIAPPDRAGELLEMLGKLRRGERLDHSEIIWVLHDRHRVDVSVTLSPVKDAGRATVGAAIIARDISRRSRTERRRAARLAVTHLLAQPAPPAEAAGSLLQAVCAGLEWDVGLLWGIDARDRVLRCEAAWRGSSAGGEEVERLSRRAAFARGAGLPGQVWECGRPAWVLGEARADDRARVEVARREGLYGDIAFPILHGGEVLGVLEFFSREAHEPDDDLLEMVATLGGQVGLFLERRRAAESLRESEQRFARFMQHLPGLAWIKDFQGRYVFVNDAAEKAFRRPRAELYGRTDDELFPPETAAQFKANDRQALEAGAGVQVIETLRHDDGILHHSIVSKFPIPGPGGAAALVGGMAIDITDRLRAEEALREADRRKDEFLAMLAHELRNPLAAIRNALHVMTQPAADAAAVGGGRLMAERQVRHMARLLDDLLDVSRISRGRIELRKEAVDVAAVLRRAVEAVRPLIEQHGHELTVALPPEPMQVQADPARLEQVVTNLLHNAAKYTEPGGRIWLTAHREGGRVVLRVRDTGIGIAPDMLPRIFDLFVRAERPPDLSAGGVGIGLTLVRKLVELHGGAVEAASAGPGLGSEFVVRLPADGGRPPPEEAKPERRDPTVLLPSRRVLVVDDNHDAADSLALLLRLAGQEVRVAYDGPSALAAAREFAPALVLLDIGMPGMDGYEVARRLRQLPGQERVLLAALTGWGQEEDRRRSLEAGFDRHLVKPLEPEELQEVLAGLQSTAPPKK